MRIHIVSNDASFFQSLYKLCHRAHPSLTITHLSEEHWVFAGPASCRAGDVVIAQLMASRIHEEAKNSRNAFAVIGHVCQNNTELIRWSPITRNDFVLWLTELSPMTTEATMSEDVVFQTPHVRLAMLEVRTRCSLIPVLRDRLMRGLRDYKVVESGRENHFCMALEEALNNAFYHGNLEISSELKEDGSSRFLDLAKERELLAPWSKRNVLVTELVSAFGLWITIQDDGSGFDVEAALERCNDPLAALMASGRGLLLMRGFSDEMFFNNKGNEVTLVVYAEGQNRELPLGTNSSVGNENRLVLA